MLSGSMRLGSRSTPGPSGARAATRNGVLAVLVSWQLIIYVWLADTGDTGTLRLDEHERDRFHAQSFQGGSPWVALGPYRIDVTTGTLRLAAQGTLRVGGLELRLLDER